MQPLLVNIIPSKDVFNQPFIKKLIDKLQISNFICQNVTCLADYETGQNILSK